jgi:ABC-type cobalt transport system substrate-binding protein
MKLEAESIGLSLRCSFLCAVILLLSFSLLAPLAFSSEGKWPGVDDSVIGKYAKEHGREPKQPLIDTDQGDLLLFAFFFAGTAGGFVGGYYWRTLMMEKAPKINKNKEEQKTI